MSAGTLDDRSRRRAEFRIGIENGRGQALEVGGFGRFDVEMAQLHLGLSPGQGLDAVVGAAVVVLLDQAQQLVTRVGDQGPERYAGDLARRHPDPVLEREDRVEHGADAVRQGLAFGDHRGSGHARSLADEAGAIGLILRVG